MTKLKKGWHTIVDSLHRSDLKIKCRLKLKKITPNNFQKYHFLFQNTRIYSLEKNPNAMLYDMTSLKPL